MKKYPIIALTLGILLASCGGQGSEGKKFAPAGKQSSMTDSERESAIAAKRNSLTATDTALIFVNTIKLTILKPKPQGKVTEQMSELVAQRMLDMVTANGIGGIGGDPAMVFACGISDTDKKLTGTAPQKTQVTLGVQYYVANVADGTVFGSLSDRVTGVGNNEDQAYKNAFSQLDNNDKIRKMLKKATENIEGTEKVPL